MSTTSSAIDLDISLKYSKLASEYARLKAQLTVLRNGFVEEQQKRNSLTSDLHDRDAQLKSSAQEIDSLTFRNQQLMKRVEVLVSRLEESVTQQQQRPKQKRKDVDRHQHQNGSLDTNSLISEQLQLRLQENEELHRKLDELEHSSTAAKITALESSVVGLEKRNHELIDEVETLKKKHSAAISHLEQEARDLRTENTSVLEQARSSPAFLIAGRRSATFCSPAMDGRSRSDTVAISPVPIVDSSREISASITIVEGEQQIKDRYDELNVPKLDLQQKRTSSTVMTKLSETGSQSVEYLINWLSYCEQRAKLYPKDSSMQEQISPICQELCDLLHTAQSSCQPLQKSICNFAPDSHTGDYSAVVNDSIAAFKAVTTFLNRVEPIISRCYEDECSTQWCTTHLDSSNRILVDNFSKLTSSLSNLHRALIPIAEKPRNAQRALKTVSTALKDLHESAQSFSKAFDDKIQAEHQLPVATRSLKTTNTCISTSLHELSSRLSGVVDIVSQNTDLLASQIAQASNTGSHIAVFTDRARMFMLSSNKLLVRSAAGGSNVPHSVSAFALGSSPPSDDPSAASAPVKQAEATARRIAELEREREQLTLESQLLRVRLGGGDSAAEVEKYMNEEAQSVEKYYSARVEELMYRMQLADSKLALYSDESRTALAHYRVSSSRNEQLESNLTESAGKIAQLQEELDSTRANYEQQLQALTEHLAELNQRITMNDEMPAGHRSGGSGRSHAHHKRKR